MPVLLARYADTSFWMARYMERVENLARILDVTESFTGDDSGASNWASIVQLNADGKNFFDRHDIADGRTVVDFYVLDRDNPTSIVSTIRMARENARTLRPLISTEMWMQINMFHGWLETLKPSDLALPKLSRLCALVKEGCKTHTGIVEGTFYRDQGWYFYRIGKLIERADQTTRLVDIKYHTLLPSAGQVGTPVDESGWNAVLRSAAGYHAYRRVHPRGMQPAKVAGFLLFDDGFARSASVCVRELNGLLTRLKSRYALRGGNHALERLDEIEAMMGDQSIEAAIGSGLHEFLDFLQRQLIRLTNDLGTDFFGYTDATSDG